MNFTEVTVQSASAGMAKVESKDVGPAAIAANAEALSAGDKVTLGVRPQDLTLDPSGNLVGQVILVERLGNETDVSLRLPSGGRPGWRCLMVITNCVRNRPCNWPLPWTRSCCLMRPAHLACRLWHEPVMAPLQWGRRTL